MQQEMAQHKVDTHVIVGISQAVLSADVTATLTTYALGSCVGMTIYDPVMKLGGMIHCLLPLSSGYPDRAKECPYMFVDTGVTKLLDEYFEHGGKKERIQVKVSGCGNMIDTASQFNIGQKNYTVLRKVLWKNGILITAEHVSGSDAKTMSLNIETGIVLVKTAGTIITL